MLQGPSAFHLAYSLVLGAMLAALVRERASIRRSLAAPLAAAAVTLAAPLALLLLDLPDRLPAGMAVDAQAVASVALLVLMGYGGGLLLARLRARPAGTPAVRGALLSGSPGVVQGAGTAVPARLTLAGVPIPEPDESRHFKLIGGAGSGKRGAICELLGGALARGDRAVIADPEGAYLARFHDRGRGDVIFNPLHAESDKWDPFDEIATEEDVEALTCALIPVGGEGQRTRHAQARTFVSALIRYCRKQADPSDHRLHHLITATPQSDLRAMLAGGPADPLLVAGQERMFGEARAVAASALAALELTSRQQGAACSVRRWMAGGKGVLFLPYQPGQTGQTGQAAAVRTMLCAWTRLALFEAIKAPAGDRRIWFVIEDLEALGAIDGLAEALIGLRHCGGRCVLGLQSIAQLSSMYGAAVAHTLTESTGNTLILGGPVSEQRASAPHASRLSGPASARSQRLLSWLAQHRPVAEPPPIAPAVLLAEIERLPGLEGFLQLASHTHWQPVRLPPAGEPAVQRPWPAAQWSTPQPGTAPPQEELPPPVAPVQSGKVAAPRRRRKAAQTNTQAGSQWDGQTGSPASSPAHSEDVRAEFPEAPQAAPAAAAPPLIPAAEPTPAEPPPAEPGTSAEGTPSPANPS